MSVTRHHAEWLNLVEVSGPFVSMPVLMRVFPQGLDNLEVTKRQDLREAYDEWLDDSGKKAAAHRAWVLHVLTRLLEYPATQLAEGQSLPPGLEATIPVHGETLRPDLALRPRDTNTRPALLITIYRPEQDLDKPIIGKTWKASPATRMMELLHATQIPVGLVTNGEHWMLVAPGEETTGFASWYADLWMQEPITLRAFVSLLHLRRLLGVAETDTLPALLKESGKDQQEVTDQLGYQVRQAVEVLVQALDRIDAESGRKLLAGVEEKTIYDAALTVMMRLVFMFAAEERGMIPPSKYRVYEGCYSLSALRDELRKRADQHCEEVLEQRCDAWCRLLATFRAVHGGVEHESMRLPAYGGTLFDPDRYPLLEGRPDGTRWTESAAKPLQINNQVVLHLLEALQLLQIKVPGGGPRETRRISFRELGIENIGHVYEGLLDHTAKRAGEVILGLAGVKDKEREIPLSILEAKRAGGTDVLVEFLHEETGRSEKALKGAIESPVMVDEHHLLIACGQDTRILKRVLPFAALIREDSFRRPVVIPEGSVYVTRGSDRRSTSTHYTPPSLTEPIVRHTLEPLVYSGPAEGKPQPEWQLKSAREILALKICDMAMGSGAFLVQTCCYLAELLDEAWENAEKANPGKILATPEGDFSEGYPKERLIPADPAERIAIARRYVADRCLYGVDINPMAVEMAKLSLWLITLQRDRPFTFLNHALKCGDSLLGISSVKQISNFTLRAKSGAEVQPIFTTINLIRCVEEASAKRRALEDLPSNDHTQIETKNRLHAEAEAATAKVKALANCLVAFELRGLDGEAYEEQRTVAADHAEVAMKKPLPEFQTYACEQLRERRTFHWPVEFPEVFARGGFDAFVGNPPFYAGSWLRTLLGEDYRRLIVSLIADGRVGIRGTADLCVYFLLRARELRQPSGLVGLILSNAVCDGDSKAVGMDFLLRDGATIMVTPGRKWPGAASVTFVSCWLYDRVGGGDWSVEGIEYSLLKLSSANTTQTGDPESLAVNSAMVCKGHELQGDGFKLDAAEANHLRAVDPRNGEVIFPLITGEVLNASPTFAPEGFVINLGRRTLDEAQAYSMPFEIIRQRVKPERDLYVGDTGRDRYLREKWWLFRGHRKEIEEYSRKHSRLLVCTVHTKYVVFAFIDSRIVATPSIFCFFFDRFSDFALLQSSLHDAWATEYASALGETLRYVAGRCFNTFPMAVTSALAALESIGQRFYDSRSNEMASRHRGLTDLYNLFHDQSEQSENLARLRALHVEMDQAVAAAYGWSDLDLGHGFHETKQGVRYTISESARRTVLDRLLVLNHQRYEEEVKAGLRDKKSGTAKSRKRRQAPGDKTLTIDFPE